MRQRSRVGEKPAREVETETNTVKLERELPRIQSFTKVSLRNGLLAHSADTIDPDFLMINEKIA